MPIRGARAAVKRTCRPRPAPRPPDNRQYHIRIFLKYSCQHWNKNRSLKLFHHMISYKHASLPVHFTFNCLTKRRGNLQQYGAKRFRSVWEIYCIYDIDNAILLTKARHFRSCLAGPAGTAVTAGPPSTQSTNRSSGIQLRFTCIIPSAM